MTLYYCMCRSWQDCCRRGGKRSWPPVSVESVDSESWCLNNANSRQWELVFEQRHFLRFHNAVNDGRTCIYFGKLFKTTYCKYRLVVWYNMLWILVNKLLILKYDPLLSWTPGISTTNDYHDQHRHDKASLYIYMNLTCTWSLWRFRNICYQLLQYFNT
jgi:hypothetical protein